LKVLYPSNEYYVTSFFFLLLFFSEFFVTELINHIENNTTNVAIVTLFCGKNIKEGRATTAVSQEWLLTERASFAWNRAKAEETT